MNKIKIRKIAKINQTKIWLFENINKIYKSIARFIRKNKKDTNYQYWKFLVQLLHPLKD